MQENTEQQKRLWFKAKCYGWGWTPATWQGWAVTLAYAAVIIAAALTIDESSPSREVIFTFALPVTLASLAMIRICYAKGESPRWRWGEGKKGPEAPKE
jgi:hypothetical protein